MFNILVPFEETQEELVRLFDWDSSIGRIRYAWLDKDCIHGYMLFKDGPTSWSEKVEEVKKAIESHPAFVKYEVLDRDTVYVVATFDLRKVKSYYDPEMIQKIIEIDNVMKEVSPSFIAITDAPFDIFDRNIEALKDGTLRPDLMEKTKEAAKKIQDAFEKGEGGMINI